MAVEDYIDDLYEGLDDCPRSATCKRCGKRNLYWDEYRDEQRNWRWRLVDKNEEPHSCRQASAREFPFEALD